MRRQGEGLDLVQVAEAARRESWPVYIPERDMKGSKWARERDTVRDRALARQAAWQKEQHNARDEPQAHMWLPADVSRRLRGIAARTGLTAEQVLAQCADQVRLTHDSTLAVDAFAPR